MTKEEAYTRLELSENADLQEVRHKFAEMHNDFRMRIENAPTPRMRQRFEQGLESLKEAYTVLNESAEMDDTYHLPYTRQIIDHAEDVVKDNWTAVPSDRPGEFEQQNMGKPNNRRSNSDPEVARQKRKIAYVALVIGAIVLLFGIWCWKRFNGISVSKKHVLSQIDNTTIASPTHMVDKSLGDKTLVLRNRLLTPQELKQLTTNASLNAKTFASELHAGDSIAVLRETETAYVLKNRQSKDTIRYYLSKADAGGFIRSLTNSKTNEANGTRSQEERRIGSDIKSKEALQVNKTVGTVTKKEKASNWRSQYKEIYDFKEGLARVRKGLKFGFVNEDGKLVIPLKYYYAHDFENGRAKVVLASVGYRSTWFYIDKQGNCVADCLKFDDKNYLYGGGAVVMLKGKYGVVDKDDQIILPIKYDWIKRADDDMFTLKLHDKWGYADKQGKLIIPLQYDDASDFKEGRAQVERNGKTFYIDKQGNCVADCPD